MIEKSRGESPLDEERNGVSYNGNEDEKIWGVGRYIEEAIKSLPEMFGKNAEPPLAEDAIDRQT